MKRKIIAGLSILIVLALSAGFYLYHKPAEKIVTKKADYALNAKELLSEYTKNEDAANTKYLNKVLSVQGKVTQISEDGSLGITVMLEAGDPLSGVSCQFPAGNNGKMPQRGENVRIKGLCSGKLMDVVLVRCVIEN